MTYLQPFFPVLLVSVTLIVLFSRGRRTAAGSILCVLLFLFCWPPAAWIPLWQLEHRYSPKVPSDKEVGAIVVLSSAVFPEDPPMQNSILGPDTYARCIYAAWLYRNWNSVPVLASGGGSAGAPYAREMRAELIRQGVPADMVWTEEKSRSTYENALFSNQLLQAKGIRKIALVTEAYHMRRAEGCYRKQGLEVVPAAFGFRGVYHDKLVELLPCADAISWNEDTMHEAIGLIWYSVLGRI